jgi:hypothetical protein
MNLSDLRCWVGRYKKTLGPSDLPDTRIALLEKFIESIKYHLVEEDVSYASFITYLSYSKTIDHSALFSEAHFASQERSLIMVFNLFRLLDNASAEKSLSKDELVAAEVTKELVILNAGVAEARALAAKARATAVKVSCTKLEATDQKSLDHALMQAAMDGRVEDGAQLIARGADIHAIDDDNNVYTALVYALERGQAAFVALLISEGVSIPAFIGSKLTLTCMACRWGDFDPAVIMALLIAAGIDIHAINEKGPALNHVASNDHVAIVALMIAANVDVNLSRRRYTPLIYAALKGNSTVVAQLIAAGANVNPVLDSRETPLMHAARKGHAAISASLLDEGANIFAVDAAGKTALSHLLEGCSFVFYPERSMPTTRASKLPVIDTLTLLIAEGVAIRNEEIAPVITALGGPAEAIITGGAAIASRAQTRRQHAVRFWAAAHPRKEDSEDGAITKPTESLKG